MPRFSRGDCVLYVEVRPRPQTPSREAIPAVREESAELVVHYMTVREVSRKGTLVLQTHQGNLHVTHSDDPNIRRAPFWQRWFQRDRFPRLNATTRTGSFRMSP